MTNELIKRLTALGMSEDMANKALVTVADFAKTKLPKQFHSHLDEVMEGKEPDLGGLGGLAGGLKGLFGGK